jgi:DNA invertase Pin-like site-specific DNA recombinase
MQINRLQNDNSSLINTVEMLTKQLLNLNTVDANIDPSSQVSKEPAPKVSKKQKKSQKKKMKAKEGIKSA